MNAQGNVSAVDFLLQYEDLLNDRYDYIGHDWSARLTQQLPDRLRLIVEGGYEIRNYQSLTTSAIWGIVFGFGRLAQRSVAFCFCDV